MTWEKDIEEGLAEYYPGSSKKIQGNVSADIEKAPQEPAGWDLKPRRDYEVNGVRYEVFSIGDLARALGRRPVTIRMWETQGYIPVDEKMRSPSVHPDKRHRIYSRAQIEGIVRIAEEEGILHEARPRIGKTRFKEKVLDLYLELVKRPLYGAVPLDEDT